MSGRFRHSSGVKIAAKKTTERRNLTESILPDRSGVDVSITSERGETRHYQAQSVTLQIVRGGMEVLQDFRGSYAWFKRCRLEARVGRECLVLGFATGVVASRSAELTIVAASDSAAARSSGISSNHQPMGRSKNNGQSKSK